MRKSLRKQDHLLHILILAGFLISLGTVNFSELGNHPGVVIGICALYVAINAAVDIQAKKFHTDLVLQYLTIGVLAAIIILSF